MYNHVLLIACFDKNFQLFENIDCQSYLEHHSLNNFSVLIGRYGFSQFIFFNVSVHFLLVRKDKKI